MGNLAFVTIGLMDFQHKIYIFLIDHSENHGNLMIIALTAKRLKSQDPLPLPNYFAVIWDHR